VKRVKSVKRVKPVKRVRQVRRVTLASKDLRVTLVNRV